jgi:hypothetical protein
VSPLLTRRISQAREASARTAEGQPTGGAGASREPAPPQHASRESTDADSLAYERDRDTELRGCAHAAINVVPASLCAAHAHLPRLQEWRQTFGAPQKHGLPTKHTGLQREYGRD